MKTSTKSVVTHRTIVTSETPSKDGGRALLLELVDDIRSDGRPGKLTAQFGIGGSLSSLIFEESETVSQRDIQVGSAD